MLFDLPAGLAEAEATLAAAGVAERCQILAGDLFVSVPADADAYLLEQVLHDWDDERAAAILRRVRAAMADDARLLILERMLGELPTLLVDLVMLTVNGGRERTERDFRALLDAAGLAGRRERRDHAVRLPHHRSRAEPAPGFMSVL